MKLLFVLLVFILIAFLAERRMARATFGTSKKKRYAMASLCAACVLFATLKTPFDWGGGDDLQERGGSDDRVTLQDPENNTKRSGGLDSDFDGVPDVHEDLVFMDKHDPNDAESREYDLTMTALEKYENEPISADWRVIDTARDGIADWWKLHYGLDVNEYLAETVCSNGCTFYDAYRLGLNPLVPATNPANWPLTDLQIIERGLNPLDTVSPAAVTNAVLGDVTVISLALSGAGSPYAQVRVGSAVVHAGNEAGQYVLRSGETFSVVVERLPAIAGGAGLPVKVSIDAVEGIIAALPEFDDNFVVPPEPENETRNGGGFAPMRAQQQTPQIDTIKIPLEAENDACIHGSCSVTAIPTSATYGVLTGGTASWQWVEQTNYGVLSPSGLTVSITVNEQAHDNWKAHKNEWGAKATQPLKLTYTPPHEWDATFAWVKGQREVEIAMGCCLTYEPEEPEEHDHPHIHCACTCCGDCCHCGNAACDDFSDCCQPSTGTFNDPQGGGSGSVSLQTLRYNNNWDLQYFANNVYYEDMLVVPMLPGALWKQDRDILSYIFLHAPCWDGSCCICRKHATAANWSGKVLAVNGVRMYDNTGVVTAPKTYAPLSTGAQQITHYVEGNTAGGWDREQYTITETGTANDKHTATNYYTTARMKVFAKTDDSGNVTDAKHRFTWNPTNIVELFTVPQGSNLTTPLGMEIRAGNHSKGHAYLELVGTGHFRVTGPGISITNGQIHAWNAPIDDIYELAVQCYSPGSVRLSVCYTNANVSGVSFKSSIKIKGRDPDIYFVDKDDAVLPFLKVGKWNDYPDTRINTNLTLHIEEEFIDFDEDSFYLRCTDMGKQGVGSFTVQLRTASDDPTYNDAPTTITLNEDPSNPGVFRSDSQLLVACDIDNLFTNSTVKANNTLGDRTHKTAVGGKVVVTYTNAPNATPYTVEKSVSPDYKIVTVNLYILNDTIGGNPVIPESVVNDHWKITNERFAQAGVKVKWNGPFIVDPPQGVTLASGISPYDSLDIHRISVNAKLVITNSITQINANATPTADDINIFYMDKVLGTSGGEVGGTALAKYWFNNQADAPYTYNVFLPKSQASPREGYVGAHELLHLFGVSTHATLDWCIMYNGIMRPSQISGSKRFTPLDEFRTLGDSHVKNQTP